jgi:hypothetical protein
MAVGRDSQNLTRWRYPLLRSGPIGSGEGNRTLMTSLEGVPHRAVMGADLHVEVSDSNRGLPLVTPANACKDCGQTA